MTDALPAWFSAARSFALHRWTGKVTRVHALAVEAAGPKATLGELCEIALEDGRAMQAEVAGLRGDRVVLMPYGDLKGLAIGAEVRATREQPTVRAGPGLLGRVIDAFGRPLDGKPVAGKLVAMPLRAPCLNPMARGAIRERLHTGVRAIDGLLPLGRGQRMGIFAGSGVGKSSLMGMLARGVEADVNVVALIGERGREVRDFVDRILPRTSLGRTVVVVATSDQPAVVRARAAYAATAVAEYFRDQGRHVFLLMDSVTRFAMARREIDLAAGQPPTSRGYTPSVFAEIPALCERSGNVEGRGSLTAMYTVLVEGDDHNEPIADTLRATLDGQLVLSRQLANEGRHPAIDVLASVSRLERHLLDGEELRAAQRVRTLPSAHERQREMVDMGLYKAGSNRELDEALARWPGIERYLRQGLDESSTASDNKRLLMAVLSAQVAAA